MWTQWYLNITVLSHETTPQNLSRWYHRHTYPPCGKFWRWSFKKFRRQLTHFDVNKTLHWFIQRRYKQWICFEHFDKRSSIYTYNYNFVTSFFFIFHHFLYLTIPKPVPVSLNRLFFMSCFFFKFRLHISSHPLPNFQKSPFVVLQLTHTFFPVFLIFVVPFF